MPELELKKLELPDFCADGPVTDREPEAGEPEPPAAAGRKAV
jgi:hypothetical protein